MSAVAGKLANVWLLAALNSGLAVVVIVLAAVLPSGGLWLWLPLLLLAVELAVLAVLVRHAIRMTRRLPVSEYVSEYGPLCLPPDDLEVPVSEYGPLCLPDLFLLPIAGGERQMSPRSRRHPAEVTLIRLAEALEKWPDAFDGRSRDEVSHIIGILDGIAEGPPADPVVFGDPRAMRGDRFG